MKIENGKPTILPSGETLDASTKIGIFDAAGQLLPLVQKFDTETCEIHLIIKLSDGEQREIDGEMKNTMQVIFGDNELPFVAKFVLPGAYAMREDGTILK